MAAQYGAAVERTVSARTVVVSMSPAIAQALSRDPRVIQVISTGEPVDRLRTYTYDASGNITAIGSDTYAYDATDRVIRGTVSGSERRYSYDAFGNRLSCGDPGGTTDCQFAATIESSTNRITGATYDVFGDLHLFHAKTYDYDEVGMLARGPGNAEYIYTADDERIATVKGATWNWTVRDVSGKVLRTFTSSGATWQWQSDNIFRDGQLLASVEPGAAPRLYHLDHLGTPRLVTDTAGTILGVHDYYAFGLEVPGNPTEPLSTNTLHFTGHERDGAGTDADALDYMHARYYSAAWGRFLSVDPSGRSVEIDSPQSWNRYAYVENNPLRFLDDDGRSKAGIFVRTLKGAWRKVEAKVAVRVAEGAEEHAVRVEGKAASREARRIAELANPGEEIIRHEAHIPKGEAHWQPKRRKGGHVGYTVLGAIFTIGTFLPYVGDFVETDLVGESDANPVLQNAAIQIFGANYNDLSLDEKAEVIRQIEAQEKERRRKAEEKKQDPPAKQEPDPKR